MVLTRYHFLKLTSEEQTKIIKENTTYIQELIKDCIDDSNNPDKISSFNPTKLNKQKLEPLKKMDQNRLERSLNILEIYKKKVNKCQQTRKYNKQQKN